MTNYNKNVSLKLQHSFRKDNIILFASGTQALSFLIESATSNNAKVGISNANCVNVLQAIICSGREPIILPNDEDGNIQFEAMQSIELNAVIGVNQFNSNYCRRRIKTFCDAKGILYIDDCCRNYFIPEKEADSEYFIDPTVISFGEGKILQNKSGGAVVLTNNSTLAQALIENRSKYLKNKNLDASFLEKLSKDHTYLYNHIFGLSFSNKDNQDIHPTKFKKKLKSYKHHILNSAPSILNAPCPIFDQEFEYKLENFKEIERDQRENGDKLLRYLKGLNKDIKIFERSKQETYWRPSARMPNMRNDLMRHIWSDGYSISSWPAPLDIFFEEFLPRKPFQSSSLFFEEIVNFDTRQSNIEHYMSNITSFFDATTSPHKEHY